MRIEPRMPSRPRLGWFDVVPRAHDRGTHEIARLQDSGETCGRAGGPVGRPAHNPGDRPTTGSLRLVASLFGPFPIRRLLLFPLAAGLFVRFFQFGNRSFGCFDPALRVG